MAEWLQHPRYRRVRDDLIRRITGRQVSFRALPPVLFLCGGQHSKARDAISAYLRKRFPAGLIFYAEVAWAELAASGPPSTDNALHLEEYLADLSDMVLVVVESPGTFCELGAFSLSPALSEKLLPVLEEKYQHEDSFIRTGPIRWLDNKSRYAPAIWAPLDRVLERAADINDRLSRIHRPRRVATHDLGKSKKQLLFLLRDLVAVTQPSSRELLSYYLTAMVPTLDKRECDRLLGLGVALSVISKRSPPGAPATAYYFARHGLAQPFSRFPFVDFPSERAKQLSVLQTLPSARPALDLLASGP